MKAVTLFAALLGSLLLAAPAAASSWLNAGGGPGNPGVQPVDPGDAPFYSAYWSNASSDQWVMNSPVVTGGAPASQRTAYGTLNGAVHVQELLTGAPVGAQSGANVDSAPVNDLDIFNGQGSGASYISFVVLEHQGGTRFLVLHNDDNQGGGISDIALAQVDAATGNVISDQAIVGTDGFNVASTPVLSDPDANGHRYLMFAATNSIGGYLGKIQIANATGSNPTLGSASGVQVGLLNVEASPTIAYLNDASGNPTQYAVVSTNAIGANPTVRSYRVSDLAAGPQSVNLSAEARTPAVPLTPSGLNPGSPGSGVATTPAIYVTVGSTGTGRAYRLSQSGNSQTLTDAAGTTLSGMPSQGMAVTQTASTGGLSAGSLVVSTDSNLYVIDAQTLAVTATHSVGGLAAGTGFAATAPTVAGDHIFIARDNGRHLALNLSDAQAATGFSEQTDNGSAVIAYGRPAVARWFALFTSDRGLFAYRTDDQVAPASSLTGPDDGSTVSGEVVVSALAGDQRGIDSVVFRVDGSPVGTVTSPASGDQFTPGAATYVSSVNTSTLSDGNHVIDVVATDESGNSAASASRTVNVDNTAPQTTLDSGPAVVSSDFAPRFEFSSTEAGSTFECSLNGSAYAPCTSPKVYGEMGIGDHVFFVRATDSFGHTDQTPASTGFRIHAPPTLKVTKGTINMTPTGRVNLPVTCPSGDASCQGVLSVWVWYRAPHGESSKPTAGDREPSYRHKRRRRRVGRKQFNVLAGRSQRLPMALGRSTRDRACDQGKLRVDVIVRRKVGTEWKLTTTKLVLRPQRCPAR